MDFHAIAKVTQDYKQACEQKSVLVDYLLKLIDNSKGKLGIERVKGEAIKIMDCELTFLHRPVFNPQNDDCYCALDVVFTKKNDVDITINTFYVHRYGIVFIKSAEEYETWLTDREMDLLSDSTVRDKLLSPIVSALLKHLEN
ncbi:hypothetical protein [Shewanella sp.]|uniref:hypothetical protein n=1 Tax=Shewanella sp. TaxID=50422 RepID=UPI003A84DF75